MLRRASSFSFFSLRFSLPGLGLSVDVRGAHGPKLSLNYPRRAAKRTPVSLMRYWGLGFETLANRIRTTDLPLGLAELGLAGDQGRTRAWFAADRRRVPRKSPAGPAASSSSMVAG
jgi:hypothetical protein